MACFFERTAISRKPEEVARQELQKLRELDRITPDPVFRDPYLLDFLGLKDTFSERDLETAILRELERFLLELWTDFAFIAPQKRMAIGNQDFYLDLLFYHRRLRRLITIDLKLGRFEAAYKGQMELYLRWLDNNERHSETEEAPIGLILCGSKDHEQIQLLQLTNVKSSLLALGDRLAPRMNDRTWHESTRQTQLTDRAEELRAALPDLIAKALDWEGFFKQRLGFAFSEHLGRRYGDAQVPIERDTHDLHGNVALWKVVRNG